MRPGRSVTVVLSGPTCGTGDQGHGWDIDEFGDAEERDQGVRDEIDKGGAAAERTGVPADFPGRTVPAAPGTLAGEMQRSSRVEDSVGAFRWAGVATSAGRRDG